MVYPVCLRCEPVLIETINYLNSCANIYLSLILHRQSLREIIRVNVRKSDLCQSETLRMPLNVFYRGLHMHSLI